MDLTSRLRHDSPIRSGLRGDWLTATPLAEHDQSEPQPFKGDLGTTGSLPCRLGTDRRARRRRWPPRSCRACAAWARGQRLRPCLPSIANSDCSAPSCATTASRYPPSPRSTCCRQEVRLLASTVIVAKHEVEFRAVANLLRQTLNHDSSCDTHAVGEGAAVDLL